MLQLDNISLNYGQVEAIRNISLTVLDGEIVALIGSNAAGKSSTLNVISGLVKPKSGTVRFKGEDITGLSPVVLVPKGICHVPEGREVFSELTVLENLEMGAFHRKARRAVLEDLEEIYQLFPKLAERKKQLAGTLSGGEQQMLAIGRGLMAKPSLMLLDEPSMGLAPIIVDEIFRLIGQINRTGTSVLLVEQNAQKALEVAKRAYVLERGQLVLAGSSKEVVDNELVRKAYLGI